jgi:hypothetical protein
MWSVTFEGTSNAPMNSLIAPAFGMVGAVNCLAYFLALAASACECR